MKFLQQLQFVCLFFAIIIVISQGFSLLFFVSFEMIVFVFLRLFLYHFLVLMFISILLVVWLSFVVVYLQSLDFFCVVIRNLRIKWKKYTTIRANLRKHNHSNRTKPTRLNRWPFSLWAIKWERVGGWWPFLRKSLLCPISLSPSLPTTIYISTQHFNTLIISWANIFILFFYH